VLRRLIPAAVAAAALAVPGVASATSTVDIHTNTIASASRSLGNYHLGGYDLLGLSNWDVDVASSAIWSGGLQTHVGWDTANVRQGAPLTATRMVPLPTGTMKVAWKISGSVYVGQMGGAFSTKSLSVDASCSPLTVGTNYECTANSPAVYLVKTPGVPSSPYVKVLFKTKFTITPEGAIVNRTLSMTDGGTSTASGLPLSQSLNYETVKVPCGPVGNPVSYRLGNIHYTPKVDAVQQPVIQVGLMDPVLGAVETPALVDRGFGPAIKASPAFDLTGSGHTTDLGYALPNNVAPSVSVGSFSGKVGVPVAFSAGVSSRCDIASYEWKFSDGTTSYGATPQRTFSSAGVFDGQLTVTDKTGLKTVKSFTVTISR
jgi:hypothetical protein